MFEAEKETCVPGGGYTMVRLGRVGGGVWSSGEGIIGRGREEGLKGGLRATFGLGDPKLT